MNRQSMHKVLVPILDEVQAGCEFLSQEVTRLKKSLTEADVLARRELRRRDAWVKYHVHNLGEKLTEQPTHAVDICRLYGGVLRKEIETKYPTLTFQDEHLEGREPGFYEALGVDTTLDSTLLLLFALGGGQTWINKQKFEYTAQGRYHLFDSAKRTGEFGSGITLSVDYARAPVERKKRGVTLFGNTNACGAVYDGVERLNEKTGLDFRFRLL